MTETSKILVLCALPLLASCGRDVAKPPSATTTAPLTAAVPAHDETQPAAAATPVRSPEPAEPAEPGLKARPACSFNAPVAFGSAVAKWEGECKDGKADGRGVLRAYESGKVTLFFFGTMRRGYPKFGVIESDGGYSFGNFAAGKIIPEEPVSPDGVQLSVAAFDEAIAAAKLVSASFENAGNHASAKYYMEKARVLERQVE